MNVNTGPLGIMFHHFHDDRSWQAQGSLSADELDGIIVNLGDRLISAETWLDLLKKGTLDENHLCLTFDDALKSQFEIAVPVLEKHNLSAFFFVYSSALMGRKEKLEIYRYYINVAFSNVEEFYKDFYSSLASRKSASHTVRDLKTLEIGSYLSEFSFYSIEDRRFRYIRDQVLSVEGYYSIMDAMISRDGYSQEQICKQLWMTEKDVRSLRESGHIVGLHSDSHPTAMNKLSYGRQLEEYEANYKHLSSLIGESIRTMAHPNNSYNSETLKVLESLEIDYGFRSNNDLRLTGSMLELPRMDWVELRKLNII